MKLTLHDLEPSSTHKVKLSGHNTKSVPNPIVLMQNLSQQQGQDIQRNYSGQNL